jgi:hypothetical protein
MIPEIAISLVTAETLEQYLQFLTKQGIKRLGHGLSSAVFNHPTMPNVVVKVIVSSDPYYLRYIEFCKKNPSNSWLPKVLGGPETRLLDTDDDWTDKPSKDRKGVSVKQKVIFVFLEKLRPSTPLERATAVDYFWSLLKEQSEDNFPKFTRFSDFGPGDWKILSKQTKDKYVATLADFLYKFDNYLDLHSANLMMRGTQLVFNDPVSLGVPEQMLVVRRSA